MLQPASQPYVGIDLHRRRSVIVQRSCEGETISATQVMNDDVVAFAKAVMAYRSCKSRSTWTTMVAS
jgi:hypothetical protein